MSKPRWFRPMVIGIGLAVLVPTTIGLVATAHGDLDLAGMARDGQPAATVAATSSALPAPAPAPAGDSWAIDGCPGTKETSAGVPIDGAIVSSPDDWVPGALNLSTARVVASGQGITVAVVDSGIKAADDAAAAGLAPVLATPISVVPGEDATDRTGHGTRMAQLIHWVAPSATILPIKVHGSVGGSRDQLAAGITVALQHGADVINVSLSGGAEDPDVTAALAAADAAGVPVLLASGTEGLDLDRFPRYPASSTAGPAAGDRIAGALVVTGSTQRGGAARQVNWGATTVGVTAPGGDLTVLGAGGKLRTAVGASVSTALTSGVTALVRQRHPERSAGDLVERLVATSRPVDGLTGRLRGGMVDVGAAIGC